MMQKEVIENESYQEHLKKLRDAIEKRSGKTVDELYHEKQKRLWDAIEMRQPDKVPVILGGTFFAAKYAGLPYSSAYYDPINWKKAYTKMIVDFEPDTWGTAGAMSSGAALDTLQTKNILWPGGTLPPDVPEQTLDGEYLREDEYDLFLEDTTGFLLRCYLPRIQGALEPLAKLPSLSDNPMMMMMFPMFASMLNTPEYQEVGRALQKAGQEQAEHLQALGNMQEDMAYLGFPPMSERGPFLGPAFDNMANAYRGWKGIVKDMYRRPDKLIAALEKINRGQLSSIHPADTSKPGPKLASAGAIHRGSDDFLSKKQWEKFYWPTWKRSMMKAIEAGYIVDIFAEGYCENRFEYFLDLPKGKVLIRFTDTDMFKAKEILGEHVSLMGSVPMDLLQIGSPSEVDEYCRKLIEICGKNGGYILRTCTDYIQDAKIENIKAMMDAVKKYGPY
jgi:hypothetical protein